MADPQDMIHEFQRHVLETGIACCKLNCNLNHVLAEEGHPSGAVRLLEMASCRQRCAAVKHADVVEAQKATFEDVFAKAVLTVHPPVEVHHEFGKHPLEKIKI